MYSFDFESLDTRRYQLVVKQKNELCPGTAGLRCLRQEAQLLLPFPGAGRLGDLEKLSIEWRRSH